MPPKKDEQSLLLKASLTNKISLTCAPRIDNLQAITHWNNKAAMGIKRAHKKDLTPNYYTLLVASVRKRQPTCFHLKNFALPVLTGRKVI
jgi:hypothetical protein